MGVEHSRHHATQQKYVYALGSFSYLSEPDEKLSNQRVVEPGFISFPKMCEATEAVLVQRLSVAAIKDDDALTPNCALAWIYTKYLTMAVGSDYSWLMQREITFQGNVLPTQSWKGAQILKSNLSLKDLMDLDSMNRCAPGIRNLMTDKLRPLAIIDFGTNEAKLFFSDKQTKEHKSLKIKGDPYKQWQSALLTKAGATESMEQSKSVVWDGVKDFLTKYQIDAEFFAYMTGIYR